MTDAFPTWLLSGVEPAFDELLASAHFEEVGQGRRGTALVRPDERGAIPIVRTTTAYRTPATRFQPIHDRIAAEIRRVAGLTHAFDNALIEHYTNASSRMKAHSDQALDLAEGSSIAVYSCYRDPARPTRRLRVRPKASGAGFEIPLAHGSVVAFTLATNRRFIHAIELVANAADNEWLGITFRTSKTFVRFVDGAPVLATGERLTLATEDERRTFFELRRRENAEADFAYPALAFTISESDLLPPSG